MSKKKQKHRVYKVGGVHTSGRYDRALMALLTALRHIIHRRGVSFISGTEAKARPNGFLNRVGLAWDWAQGTATSDGDKAPYGTKECWLMWKVAVWELVGKPSSPVMSHEQYHTARGGLMPKFRAHRVKLKHKKSGVLFIFYIVHMPLDNTDLRARVWFLAADGLTTLMADDARKFPGAVQVLQGDINENFCNPVERKRMEQYLAKPTNTKQSWLGHVPKTGGTHGPHSLIDQTFTNATVDNCYLLPDDKSSDHRPYKVVLSFDSIVWNNIHGGRDE